MAASVGLAVYGNLRSLSYLLLVVLVLQLGLEWVHMYPLLFVVVNRHLTIPICMEDFLQIAETAVAPPTKCTILLQKLNFSLRPTEKLHIFIANIAVLSEKIFSIAGDLLTLGYQIEIFTVSIC